MRTRTSAALGSLLFLVVAPGLVAGVVPWLMTGWEVGRSMPGWWEPLRVVGVGLLAAGTVVLVHAFVRFVREGIGTPAPVAPTERLVVGGLYRYVRNPMYLAVLACLAGQALLLARPILLGYGGAVASAFVAFVLGYEEPALRRRFGSDYDRYRATVPAWLPRRPSH